MSEVGTPPIIVEVSEPGASEGALRFAVDQALRQRCAPTIVHARSDSPTAPLTNMRIDFSGHTDNSPHDWKLNLHHNRIAAGIDDFESSADVLRTSFVSAWRREATLHVAHDWNVISTAGSVVLATNRSEQALAALLPPWQRRFPTVRVVQTVAQRGTIESLLEYSQESDLLILGRLRVRLPLPLGSIARAMVNQAHCPVEIVPHFVGSGAKKTRGPEPERGVAGASTGFDGHRTRPKGDIAFDPARERRRVGICPGRMTINGISGVDGVVAGNALPVAQRSHP